MDVVDEIFNVGACVVIFHLTYHTCDEGGDKRAFLGLRIDKKSKFERYKNKSTSRRRTHPVGM